MNKLYFGDNLEILRDKISSDCIDLIYLDPPFQSGKNYNFIFEPELNRVKGATAQHESFGDTWKWGDKAEREYQGLITGTLTIEKPNQELIELIKAMRGYLTERSPILAYLCMMSPRLLEMRRVLKDTGSIYLHCDPTASHYLKLLMDAIFGVENFRNEIVWHYRRWTGKAKCFQKLHDIILFYTKSKNYYFNILYTDYTEGSVERKKQGMLNRFKNGETYLVSNKEVDSKGVRENDVWHIPFIAPSAKERIGYPTQKPEALLERIIKASSNEGDVVCDPFCGCGTAIAVAERFDRQWIGIDITPLAIDIIKNRLIGHGGIKEDVHFEIDGIPKDVYGAEKLAEKDAKKFEEWAVLKINGGTPCGKSGDQGVDGIINFIEPTNKNRVGKGVIQVKGTDAVSPSMVRELKGTLKSQQAEFAILITKKKPTAGMTTEAVKEGYYRYKLYQGVEDIPKIQLLWVADLFKDPMPVKLPSFQNILEPYKKPVMKGRKQGDLFIRSK